MTHTTTPPPGRRVPRLTVPPGGGHSGCPSGFTGWGPPEQNTERRPWRCRELRRPWQVVFMVVASSLGPATPAGTLLPPQKMSMGHLGVSGARHRNRTHSNKTVYRTIQTGQNNPQEQEALLGRARKLRSQQGMTWSQEPSPGYLRNRSHIYDRRGRRHL